MSTCYMGMFGFLKKKKVSAPKAEVGRIEFKDIKKWVDEKESGLLEEEKLAIDGVSKKLDDFYVSLGEKLATLEAVDLEKKKEHERAKILVLQGLNKYIDSVHTLIKDLKRLKKNDLSELAGEIGHVFVGFEKSSAKVYERATYLVGDEMAAVRNEIRRFYNGLPQMFGNALVGDLKKIVNIKSKLSEIEKVESVHGEVEEEISARDKKIDKANTEIKKLKREIDEIRNSSDYIAGSRAREEIKRAGAGVNGEIEKLKGLIDFKKLSHIVHSNQRELELVKEHKDHFVSEFSRDSGKRILDLLEGSNMKSADIMSQVDLIEKKIKELDKMKSKVVIDYTIAPLEEIKKIEESRESIELENIKSSRRLEELELKLRGMKNEVVGIVNS